MENEKTTVLLIEDNPGDARLIQEYLSESGSDIFRLERVDRISLGLERFSKGDIGVILLDLTLPDSQGLEGLTKVLAKAPHVPVVVLSGVKDEKIAIEAVHAGAQDYLVKGSVDANLLVRLLRHAIERHRLRVALRQSESRYRLLAENIADVVWVADEKGWITYVSPSVERLLGYTVEEVERLSIRDILTAGSADQARRFIKNQMEVGVQQSRSSPLSLTLEHVRKDGSTVWAEVMLSFLLDKKGNFAGIMGSTRDVTARKIAEEALQRSEEHFRALIENASDAVVILNSSGVVCYESPSVEHVLGYRVVDRIGKSAFEFVHPQDRPKVDSSFSELLQRPDATVSTEFRIKHKDGSWHTIDAVGRNLWHNPAVAGLVVNFRDVTERKKAEEARRESETRFRTVFEGTGVAMALIDKRGIPLGINPAFSRMFGYSFEEFCGINKLKYLYPDDAMVDAGLYMEMLNGKRDHYTIDKRYIRKSGEVIWGRQNLSTVRDTEGKPEYFIAMIEDITERKRMEEELIALSNAFRATLDPVLILDMEGNVREANDAARRLFETDEPGISAMKYVVPEDKEKVAAVLQDLVTSGTPGIAQFNIVTRTGRRVPLEASGSLILGANKEPVGVVIVERDLTERKKMEEELIRLSDAVRMSTESMFIADLEGKILDANQAALKMFGAANKAVLIGRGIMELITAGDREKAFENMRNALEEKLLKPIEYHMVRNDGSVILAEISASALKGGNGEPTGFVAVARDITERKRMEEVLKQSEEQFRALVENALDAIVVVNGDGVITYASPSNERMLGYPVEQTIGMDGFGFAHPEDMPRVVSAFTKLIEEPGKSVSVQLRIRHSDGSWLTVEAITKNMVEDEAVKGIVINWRDITERKKAEEALRESEERLRLYFESVSDVIYSLDKDFRVVSVSPSVEKVLGYKPEETVGKRFNEISLLAPETLRQAFVDVTRVLGGERIVTYGKFVRRDGGIIHGEVSLTPIFAADGSITGVLGVARDVTERKKAEEALRLSERDYKILFESTLDGLVVLDAETMRIVLTNQTAAKLAGISSADDLTGLDPFEFIPAENRDAVRNIVREDVFENNLHRIHEYRVFTTEGKEAWVSAVSTRTEYQGKKAALISVRDITERKKAEEEKRKMEEQLRLAGRLAAVGELAAGVAHELNNPITAVQGYAQLLSAKKDIDESVKKDLNTIYREAQRAGKITKNLLSFARRHEPEKRFISINEAIERTLELNAHQMKIHNIELAVELDQKLPGTMADFHQMQQVFVNIINNAEQAMLESHGKGKLIVKTSRSGDMIQIIFTDDGPGIPEENLKRIFDPFFTTKGVGKGTGLGLSICYGLVEAHNGRIYTRSQLGEGATFVVEIPIITDERPAEAAFIKTKKGSAIWSK